MLIVILLLVYIGEKYESLYVEKIRISYSDFYIFGFLCVVFLLFSIGNLSNSLVGDQLYHAQASQSQAIQITDQLISVLGDGSEKIMYYLGRNKNALNEFKSLLIDDGTGIKASIFLGKLQQRLLTTKRKTSKAPPPGSDVTGDDAVSTVKASTLLKKRKAAIKKGDLQAAYNVKKQAKLAGVDVSNW